MMVRNPSIPEDVQVPSYQFFFFFLCPRHFQWGVGWGAYSITTVRRYVCPVRPVRNTFGFRVISFERIGVLD